MGAISFIIFAPCVEPLLAGALVYIRQTHDKVIGASALFARAVRMSMPLMLVGISAGSLFPRAEAWTESVKRFFGVLMLVVALWMVLPVILVLATMLGWRLAIVPTCDKLSIALFDMAFRVVFMVCGLAKLVGCMTSGRDLLAPLAQPGYGQVNAHTQFVFIKSVAELDAALAQTNGKTVLLDFYANWCVS